MTESANKNTGFTLIELLIAMAIGAIVLAAIISAYQVQAKGRISQEINIDMQQTARAALQIMTQDIQSAGIEVSQNEILTSDPADFVFVRDINDDAGTFLPDGDTNDPGEQVRYVLNGNQLQRDFSDGNGLVTLADNVDALDFQYLDNTGTPTNNDNSVERVQVTLVVRANREPWLISYVNNETYENQLNPPQTIYTAPGDGFRRLCLTKTIYCPNLRF